MAEKNIKNGKQLSEFSLVCQKALDEKLISCFELPSGLGTKSRYRTYKPIVNDIRFDSLLEARYYIFLLGELASGKIKGFERQVAYELQPRFYKNGKTYRPINYIADFVVKKSDGTTDVIDVKGKETIDFKIKRKLFEYMYPDLHMRTLQFYPETGEWLDTDIIRKFVRKKKKQVVPGEHRNRRKQRGPV